jgi:tetratricopeptide (TPR) repeat protein
VKIFLTPQGALMAKLKVLRELAKVAATLVMPFFSEFGFAQTASSACGSLNNAYGPYDFRTDKERLPIVLGAHFTPEVEALLRGKTSAKPGNDIDYTLRAIPNNPRALVAMMNLGEKEKTTRPSGANYSVECYFDRALRFRPDDNVVRLIFASFLAKNNREEDSKKHLEYVVETAGENAFTHFNAGMVYATLKDYDRALKQGLRAKELGLGWTELSDQLKAVGKWVEPGESPSATPASPATPSSSSR